MKPWCLLLLLLPFSGDNWAGFDAAKIKALLGQKHQQLHSLLVYKDGKLVIEQYYPGNNDFIEFENNIKRNRSRPAMQWDADKKHYVASVNKAVTATLTGIALAQLGIDVKQPIGPLLPRYQHHFKRPELAALTIEDVLTMRMGFEWDEWTNDDLAKLWHSDDFTGFLLARKNSGPGIKAPWRYNSAGPNMLLRALQNRLKQPIRNWADKHFFARLGITDYEWQSQPGRAGEQLPEGSARLFLRPRDMLKIGITYLQGGQWQGQQVIPAAWVKAVAQVQSGSEAGDYSYLFWHRQVDGSAYYSADGDGGQYINIFPQHNMVMVMTGGNYGQWPDYADQATKIMQQILAPLNNPS